MLNNKRVISILSILILLIIWKFLSLKLGEDIILPSPELVFRSVIKIATEKEFWKKILSSILRGFWGFSISYICGVLIGLPAGICPRFKAFIYPGLNIIKSTPVISIILLALIWIKADYVPIFVSFLMAFPIVCENIIQGVGTVDKNLLEMARLYKIPFKKQLLSIYIPSITPFTIAGAYLSLGVVWKVIVAAEVLSQPKWAIGSSLYEAKAFLITEDVFAWTIIAVSLGSITEKIFTLIISKRRRYEYKN